MVSEGRETGEGRSGAGGGTGTCRGEVRTAAGSPGRRLSGTASLRFRGGGLLGLTAGPEPQRSRGGRGLTILPAGPSHQIGTDCVRLAGEATSLTFPAGGASARASDPAAEATTRGGGREEED